MKKNYNILIIPKGQDVSKPLANSQGRPLFFNSFCISRAVISRDWIIKEDTSNNKIKTTT